MNWAAVEVKAFPAATDFDLSKQFDVTVGCEIPWSSEDLAYSVTAVQASCSRLLGQSCRSITRLAARVIRLLDFALRPFAAAVLDHDAAIVGIHVISSCRRHFH